MMINLDGIQANMAVLMYCTFQVNKFGFRILFYTISTKIFCKKKKFDRKNFSADGNYEVTLMTKATVYYDGRVIWEVGGEDGKEYHERCYLFIL